MKTHAHPQTIKETQTAETLVLGGNGKTGRRIVERMQVLGRSVRVGSRSASPAFDWNAPENWGPVLDGVDALYVAYHPDLAVPGATEHIRELVAQSERRKVKRIVLLSGRGEEEAQLCERIVMSSKIPSTVLRCSWFNQNFSESFLRDMVMDGTIALPVNGVREPFVDADDIAEAAVAALTGEGHAGKLYEITGPRLMTFAEATAEIAAATGRELRFVEIPNAEFVAGLKAAGLPPEMVKLIDYLFNEVLDGRNEKLGDGIQQALGREPGDFAQFVRAARDAQAWT